MPLLLPPTQRMSEKTCEKHGVKSSECLRSHRIEGAVIGGSIGAAVGGTFGRFKTALYMGALGAGLGAMFPDAAAAVQEKRQGKAKSGRHAAKRSGNGSD